ncbi:MAG TPA: hypothetical protein VGY58_01090 [Gemmataceae bacterium]|nr:hypothetical protein [Gemmataceae bacterium]
MKDFSRRGVWLAVFCIGAVIGCQSADRLPYAHDPLLASKRPVRGSEGRDLPALAALAEPSPPALPASAYASLPPAYRIGMAPLELSPLPSPGLYADSNEEPAPAKKPVTATLVPPVKTSGGVPAIPVGRAKESASPGHAADFSWVEGMLECAKSGQWQLRYAASAAGEPWNGCVMLELGVYSQLPPLREGAVVRVDGEIVSSAGDASPAPMYRVRRLFIVR